MDRIERFRTISDRLRDVESLSETMAGAGFEKKDVRAVRYMSSSAAEDLLEAIGTDDPAAAFKAIDRISEETSMDRDAVASIIEDIRAAQDLDRPGTPFEKLMEVKNAGNNLFAGEGGYMFRPDPDRQRSLGLYRYAGSEEEAVIPEAVRMGGLRYEIESISDSAFKKTGVKAVSIHDGIKRIGDGAFKECEILETVMIPATVRSIGDGAFMGCPRLRSIELEEGSECFRSVNGLILSADGRTVLHAPGALDGEAVVPDGVEAIGHFAFWGCSSMTSVRLPGSLKAIMPSAFARCSGLRSIRIPASVESIGEYALNGCSSMTSIEVEDGSASFASSGGCLYSRDMKVLLRAPGGLSGRAEVSGPEEIGAGAFSLCGMLESVSIGSSVRRIGRDAFKGCDRLASADMAEGLESIDRYAFMGCSSLKALRIPDSVREIGPWAFGDCPSIESASVPSSLELGPSVLPQGTRVERRRGNNP